MSYCVNCGVELGDSEKKCPLCLTKVINPGRKTNPDAAPYPPYHHSADQKVRKSGIVIILTLIFLLPTSIVAMADISMNLQITWSGFVLGAFLLLYLAIAPPIAFKKTLPVLFILIDALSLSLYLLYIEQATGGDWFFSVALPIVLGLAAAVSVLITLARKAKLMGLKLCAFALFTAAFLPVLIEWRINASFGLHSFFAWALYPFIVCIILGAICLVIDRNAPLKEKLARKFFL
jgi:hypothetical protein